MKNLLGFLCVLLLCSFTLPWQWHNFFSTQATGRVFFIAPNGNDANSATQAQSQSTPWKTLGSHTGSLAANDTVKYQCGGTYFDSADVRVPVALTSYGSGTQPVITGFYTVSIWTSLGNGIYESEAIPNNVTVNMVAINGKAYAMGRYPNANASNGGYLTFESHSGTASITDNNLASTAITSAYNGAQVVMRVTHYQTARATITSVSGNTISFSGYLASGGGSLADNYGYFVQNSFNTLDQFGEWYYNPATKKIDVFFGSAGPTGNTVQVAIKDKLLFTHANNITISGLTFSGANECIFSDWTERNLNINNCNFLFAGYSHIGLANMKITNITNCTFNWANCNAGAWFYQDTSLTVHNCKISNISTLIGMFLSDPNANSCGNGLYLGGTDSVLVDNNDFKNMGYIAVRMNEGNNVTIQNNNCDSFEFALDDAGAYYTWGASGSTKVLHDRYILNNVATNGLPTLFGIPASDGPFGGGIYTDDHSKNIVISGNTVAHTTYRGLYMHNAQNITITGNTFYDNTVDAIETQHDLSAVSMTGLILKKNKILAKTTGQVLVNLRSSFNDFNTIFSAIDSNYYGRATNDNSAFISFFFSGSQTTYNFAGWKSFIGGEVHSVRTNIADISKVIFKTNYSRAVSRDYDVCTACIGFDSVRVVNKFSLSPYSSTLIIHP